MPNKWSLGGYEFEIKPNSYTEDIKFMGDIFRSLSGKTIHQPSTVLKGYSLSAIFFQLNPKFLYESGISNAHSIEYFNGKFHVLDKINKKIYRYSSNLTTLEKTTTIPALSGSNYASFDVTYESSDYMYYIITNSTPQGNIAKINSNGTQLSNNVIGISSVTFTGLQYKNSSVWAVTEENKLYQFDLSGNQIAYLELPYVSYATNGYQGMSYDNGYLVLSYGDENGCGCYHIDMWNGAVVNNFHIDNVNIKDIHDVTIIDGKYVFLKRNLGLLSYARGNTVDLDLYNLEKSIKESSVVQLIDDMDIKRDVAVSSYNIQRLPSSVKKYSVDISADRVDRGV